MFFEGRPGEEDIPFFLQDSSMVPQEEFCKRGVLAEFESCGFCEDQGLLINFARQKFSISLNVFMSHALLLKIRLIPP